MLKQLTFKSPPYHILWRAAITSFILAWWFGDKVIDIQLHDTYIVLDLFNVGIVGSAIMAIFGLIYWILKATPLTRWMSTTHAWVSAICVSIFLATFLVQTIFANDQRPASNGMTILFVLIFTVFIGVQGLLPLNLLRGLIKQTSDS